MFILTPGDLNALVGETTEEAGSRTVRNLTTALREVEESRRAETFLRGAAMGAAAVVANPVFSLRRVAGRS